MIRKSATFIGRLANISARARRRANGIAALLRSATTEFGQRIVRNRRAYTRKMKHRLGPLSPWNEGWA